MTEPPITVYVPGDAGARSVGSDEVAAAILDGAAGSGREVRLVRNGTRGLSFLEPLVEVETAAGRVGYGPVHPGDVGGLLAGGLLDGGDHPSRIGPVETHGFLAGQQRVSFARVGVTDPFSLEQYEALGGLAGLRRALELDPGEIVSEVTASGLRGRGGAGFPAGRKWATVREAQGEEKFVCVNGDEGDSGTFADRMLMEGDPFLLVEGAVVAALAVGATECFFYVRSEYPDAIRALRRALATAYEAGLLGPSVLGSGRRVEGAIRSGAGSYLCGEETAMLESLEGRRGIVRSKPPVPALSGLFGRPTLVHNVLTLAAVPTVLAEGAEAYAALGTERSRGTQVVQLGGNVRRGGIVEVPFGVSLRQVVEEFGGGTATGRPVRAVQVGGPLGAYLPADRLDLPLDYEAFAEHGAMLGHGGVVVFDDTVDMGAQARFAMAFCAAESCGKCTPCRIGSVRGVEVIDRIRAGVEVAENLALLDDLLETMTEGSLCAMGGLTPQPVRSVLDWFPDDLVHGGGARR